MAHRHTLGAVACLLASRKPQLLLLPVQPEPPHAGSTSKGWLTGGLCCRYKDAVNECTAALEAQPNYHKALTRRSKAYEHMGLYKQALSDVQKSNKAGEATPESLVRFWQLAAAGIGLLCPCFPRGAGMWIWMCQSAASRRPELSPWSSINQVVLYTSCHLCLGVAVVS